MTEKKTGLVITEARLQQIVQEELEYAEDCKYLDECVLSEAGFLSGLKGLAKGAGRGLKKGAEAIGKGVKGAAQAAGRKVADTAGKVGSAVAGAAKGVSQAARQAMMKQIIEDSANKIKQQLADLTKNVLADEKVKKAGLSNEEVAKMVQTALQQALGGTTGAKVAQHLGAGEKTSKKDDSPEISTQEDSAGDNSDSIFNKPETSTKSEPRRDKEGRVLPPRNKARQEEPGGIVAQAEKEKTSDTGFGDEPKKKSPPRNPARKDQPTKSTATGKGDPKAEASHAQQQIMKQGKDVKKWSDQTKKQYRSLIDKFNAGDRYAGLNLGILHQSNPALAKMYPKLHQQLKDQDMIGEVAKKLYKILYLD